MKIQLKEDFVKIYSNETDLRMFFASGRINIIGEHIDYNGGLVLPAAISYGTYALIRKRSDKNIFFSSLNFKEDKVITCELNELKYDEKHRWANFPKGMIAGFIDKGYLIDSGFEVLFYGNIPNAAGLSSSASIEMVTGIMLKELFDLDVGTKEMVKIAQSVENNYIGVNSGIMDQFSVGFGKKNHAILLDCDTLNYKYAPIKLDNHTIMIMHTNKQRTLVESKYNKRRKQCMEALEDLKKIVDINHLCELTPERYEEVKHIIDDETNERRARHAIYENARTKEGFKRLKAGDYTRFGQLLNESHQSLEKDYEVTGLELDVIVDAAKKQDGVLGARMTGAGFGGCAIAIVNNNNVEVFMENVNRIYKNKIGYEASFYEAILSDGIKEIKGV